MENNMKDRAIIELIDKWLDLRFPNADKYYRAEWHNRYEKCGIEFTIHMDGDSKHLWKKVYLEFLDVPTQDLGCPRPDSGHWIVTLTTTKDHDRPEVPLVDTWSVFDNKQDADNHYKKILKRDDLYTASITKVIESTDYWEGR